MNKTLTDRKTYYAIDLAKFCMAIMVVAIHTGPFEYTDSALIRRVFTTITELAVPFFFVASGFFLFGKQDWQLRIVSYAKRMFRLYVVWNIVYLPIAIFGFIHNGVAVKTALLLFVRGFFLIGQQFYSWHLWYILSLIYAVLLINSIKRKSTYVRYCVSLIIFVLGAIITSIVTDGGEISAFSVIIRLVRSTIINGRIFMGIGYLGLGMLIAEKKMAFNRDVLAIITLGCTVLSMIIPYSIIVLVLRYVTVLCLFLWIKQANLHASSLYIKLRQSSMVVYFTHMLIFFAWSAMNNFQQVNGMRAFIVVSSVAVVISFIVNFCRGYKYYDEIYNIFFS